MQYKLFGPTGKKVFSIGLGTYGHGEAYGGITKEESLEIFHAAFEYITGEANLLIDTAPRYGNGEVETWIGESLKKYKKDNILIATKGGRHIESGRVNEKDFSASFLQADLDGSLRRLGAESIFLYQLHNPSLDVILEGSVFDFLEKMREQGKIQWYGVSIDTADEGLAVIDVCRKRGYKGLASIQLIYNILQKQVLEEIQRRSRRINLAIIVREPLLRGFLTDLYDENVDIPKLPPAPKKIADLYDKHELFPRVKTVRGFLNEQGITLAQLALQFVLANPLITTVIPGINKKEYVDIDFSLDQDNLSLELINQLQKFDNLKGVVS